MGKYFSSDELAVMFSSLGLTKETAADKLKAKKESLAKGLVDTKVATAEAKKKLDSLNAETKEVSKMLKITSDVLKKI